MPLANLHAFLICTILFSVECALHDCTVPHQLLVSGGNIT